MNHHFLAAFLLSLTFPVAGFAEKNLPRRVILGLSRPLAEQVWILEEAEQTYYVKLGREATPLLKAFPHVPYPLAYVQFRMVCSPTPGCETSTLFDIHKINNAAAFGAIMVYSLTKTDQGYRLDIVATQIRDTTQTATLSLNFPNEEVLAE